MIIDVLGAITPRQPACARDPKLPVVSFCSPPVDDEQLPALSKRCSDRVLCLPGAPAPVWEQPIHGQYRLRQDQT